MMGGVLSVLALTDQRNRADPYPVLRQLREMSPFRPQDGLVIVGKYADCSRVLRDTSMSAERTRSRLAAGAHGPRTRNFLHLDPPDHTRLRGLVAKAFSPRVVAALEPRIRAIADDLFRQVAAAGRMEVVRDLAYPLPLRVICELLGVPYADHPLFHAWSARLSEGLDPPLPGLVSTETTAEAARARAEFVAYFRQLIAERRAAPRDDLVSYLIQVEEDGDRLSESELLATCVLLINAGHETTVNLIANAVLALLRHPAELELLRAAPGLASAAVEEVMRYDAPVQVTSRVARTAGALGGSAVEPGDLVLLLFGAAGRDPATYPDPDRFSLRRTPVPAHLGFSAGPHFCLGASLARLEVRIALEMFAGRLLGPRLDERSLIYKPNLTLRGPARMDVEFDGAPVG